MEAHFGLFMPNGFRKAPGAHVGLPEQQHPEQALYDICFRTLKLTTPTYGDLNHLVSNWQHS